MTQSNKPATLLPVAAAAFVGRGRELEQFRQALSAAKGGAGQCLALAGEAGLGKTRLLAQARKMALESGFQVFEGQCFEPDLSFPYAPLIDALRGYCAQRDPAKILEGFGPLGPELVKLLPELSLRLPQLQPTPALAPEAEKRRQFEALTHFLTGLSQHQPLLCILEDIHWSDETSLEFLLYAARRLTNFPILLLVSYRRDTQPSRLGQVLAQLEQGGWLHEIALAPFNRSEVEALLQALLSQSRPIQASLIDLVFPLAEGNPFFVEELVKSLVGSGEIFATDGTWKRRPLPEIDVPRTVQAALYHRLAGLSSGARRVLQVAAVVGRRFDFSLLQSVTAIDEPALLETLKELVQAQLVDEESAEVFAFHHALAREAVYGTLLQRERRALHLQVAERIELLYATLPEAHLGDLSYHFYEANAWEKAGRYAQQAGEWAGRMAAPREAIEHFTRAIRAARQLGHQPGFALLRARGQAYETVGNFAAARADDEAAMAEARATNNRIAEWQALLDLGFLWAANDYTQSLNYCEQALALAQSIGDAALIGRALNRLGNVYTNSGRLQEALSHHQQALEVFEELNDPQGLAETLDLLGVITSFLGQVKISTDYFKRAVALFKDLGDAQGQASSLAMLSEYGPMSAEHDFGNITLTFEESLAAATTSARLCRELGWRSGEAFAEMHVGILWASQGDVGRALESLLFGLAIAEEIGHLQWCTAGHLMVGALYVTMLGFEIALPHLEKGLALARESQSPHWTTNCLVELALYYLGQNQVGPARAQLDQIDLAVADSFLRWVILRAQAWLLFAEGHPTEALAAIDALLKYGQPDAPDAVVPNLWLLRGEILAALQRWDDALEILMRTKDVATKFGAKSVLSRAHLAVGNLYRVQGHKAEAEQEFAAARQQLEAMAVTIPQADLRANFLTRTQAWFPGTSPISERQAAKREFGGLTARERDVAALVGQGKSNREIAAALVLGERTVETHVGNILSKLGFTSRAQIAVWASEKGLLA